MKLTASTFSNRAFLFPRRARTTALWAAGMLFAASAMAADGGVTVDHAWVRATMPGQTSASLQFSITSSRAAKLAAISTPAAGTVEIHGMAAEGGAMKMRKADSLALPAGKRVDLKGSGNHIMLLDLKRPLKAGDGLPFTLTVQYADGGRETVDARAEVRPMSGMGGMHDMHDMPGM